MNIPDREFIEKIVKEVVAEETKPPLLAIHSSTERTMKQVKALRRHWKVIGLSYEDQDIPEGIERAVFLDVDQDLLVKAAVGITDTQGGQLFSKLMVHNVQVYFILSPDLKRILSRDETLFKHKKYIEHLRHYEKQLQDFGVHFSSLESLLSNEIDPNRYSPSNRSIVFSEKLLTQKIVETWKADRIMVHSDTLITPLARDTAKERGIAICEHDS